MTIKETLQHIHQVYQQLDPNGIYDFGYTTYNDTYRVFDILKNGNVWHQTDCFEDYLQAVLELFNDITNARG